MGKDRPAAPSGAGDDERAMAEMRAQVEPIAFEKPNGRFPSRDELHERPGSGTEPDLLP